MPLYFEFSDGETIEIQDPLDHPIYTSSSFVRNTIECAPANDDQYQTMNVTIPLPADIDYSSMRNFLDFLVLHTKANKQLGFGKYSDLSYQDVLRQHKGFYRWGVTQSEPSDDLKEFLEWANFHLRGCKPESSLHELNLIAKFFQIDMCVGCGIFGPLAGLFTTTNGEFLQPCCRTAWPNVPVLPDWKTITKDMDTENPRKLFDAWQKGWEEAEKIRKDTGEVVCCSNEKLCGDCIQRKGCSQCHQFECEVCTTNKEKPKIFEKWFRESLKRYEGTNGLRGECPFLAMNVKMCWKCGGRVCNQCGHECIYCYRRACGRCKEDLLDTGCFIHKGTESMRSTEYVCKPCLFMAPRFCRCGSPTYNEPFYCYTLDSSERELLETVCK